MYVYGHNHCPSDVYITCHQGHIGDRTHRQCRLDQLGIHSVEAEWICVENAQDHDEHHVNPVTW